MPLLLPKQRGLRRETNYTGRPTESTWGTALASDGVAHTEPATETQLIASTAFDTDWVCIRFTNNSTANTNSDSLVNIKVGAAGSEQTIIENLFAGWVTGPNNYIQYEFPIRIPAGSRISATHRSVRTATNVYCLIELYGGGDGLHWVGTGVESVGEATASSGGVAVTPGTTSEGTLTSMGTNTYDWGFVVPWASCNPDTTLIADILSFDLASGSTTGDLIPGLEDFFTTSNASEFYVDSPLGRYCHIPAGTTLYLRSQFGGAAEAKDWIIYGVY